MSMDRQEPLRNLGTMVARIRTTGGTGRLALRNTVRMGMLHLYFERGQLVQLEGSRASIDDALIDLAGWNEGLIRFDNGVVPERQTVTPTQREFFQRTLLLLQQHGVVDPVSRNTSPSPAPSPPSAPLVNSSHPLPQTTPMRLPSAPPSPQRLPAPRKPAPDALPPAPESLRRAQKASSGHPPRGSGPLPGFPSSPPPGTADVLLSARQWMVLMDVMHAVLESVGRLFGQRQAQNILQHVLVERSTESAVLRLLQVDRQGGLREVEAHEMEMQPVREVAAAFVLLIGDFEYRCATLLGEEKARQMIAQALYPYHDDLAEIGIALN
jgi:hypothetical protein